MQSLRLWSQFSKLEEKKWHCEILKKKFQFFSPLKFLFMFIFLFLHNDVMCLLVSLLSFRVQLIPLNVAQLSWLSTWSPHWFSFYLFLMALTQWYVESKAQLHCFFFFQSLHSLSLSVLYRFCVFAPFCGSSLGPQNFSKYSLQKKGAVRPAGAARAAVCPLFNS